MFGIRKRYALWREGHPAGAQYVAGIRTLFLVGIPVGIIRMFAGNLPGNFLLLGSLLLLSVFVLFRFFYLNESFSTIFHEHLTFLPAWHPDREERYRSIPWGTYGLMYANILVYWMEPFPIENGFISNNLFCLPQEPNAWNVPLSFVTSMFLHANPSHLAGNMFFLWAFGSAVERRCGLRAFVGAYLAAGVFGNAVSVAFVWHYLETDVCGLGASGAVMGVMGMYAVRCYHRRMLVPIPLMGLEMLLPLSIRFKVPSTIVMAWCFLAVKVGVSRQVEGWGGGINHLAHAGGIIAGVFVARYLNMSEDALEEVRLDAGLASLRNGIIRDDAKRRGIGLHESEGELRKILALRPDHEEALLQLARILSHFGPTEEGKAAYRRALPLLLRRRIGIVPEVFGEYFDRYADIADPETQFAISSLLEREGHLNLSARSFEYLSISSETSPRLKRLAKLRESSILEKMGLPEAADVARKDAEAIDEAEIAADSAAATGGDLSSAGEAIAVGEPMPEDPSRYPGAQATGRAGLSDIRLDRGVAPGVRRFEHGKVNPDPALEEPTPEETKRLKVALAALAVGGAVAAGPMYFAGWIRGSAYDPLEEPAKARVETIPILEIRGEQISQVGTRTLLVIRNRDVSLEVLAWDEGKRCFRRSSRK